MTASGMPLADLHVLDLSSFVAGPSCTMTLGQLGAHVIRVDQRGGGPDSRRFPLASDDSSLYWAGLNKGKSSLELDLRSDEGRAVVHRLLATPGDGYGILVTNAVGQGWLDYDQLCAVRPDLILVHLTGRSDGSSAVDYTINCETGLPLLTGPAELTSPVNSVLPSWDLLAGLHAAIAVLTAHRERTSTGRGRLVRLSLADVAASTLGHLGYVADAVLNGTERRREGNSLYGSYGNDFGLADGRRIMLVALTGRHWRNLVTTTGIGAEVDALEHRLGVSLADEGSRYRHRDAVTELLAPWFAARTRSEAAAALDEAGLPWGDYRTVGEMVREPDGLVAASRIFETREQSDVGSYPVPRTVAVSEGWDAAELRASAVPVDAEQALASWLATNHDHALTAPTQGVER